MSSKQREALSEILELINKWRTDGVMEHWQYSQLFDVADNALGEPLKNCEVGTIKEQSDRFAYFCRKHSKGCGLGYGGKWIGHPKVTCPAFKDMECSIVWGQFPYESEVK